MEATRFLVALLVTAAAIAARVESAREGVVYDTKDKSSRRAEKIKKYYAVSRVRKIQCLQQVIGALWYICL